MKTIDINELDTVTGGKKLPKPVTDKIKQGGKWLWDNVAKPTGAAAAWDWASDKLSGGQQ